MFRVVKEFFAQIPEGVESLTSGAYKWAAASLAPTACIVLLVMLMWGPYREALGEPGPILAIVLALAVCAFADHAATRWRRGEKLVAGVFLALSLACVSVDMWVAHAAKQVELQRKAELLEEVRAAQEELGAWATLTAPQVERETRAVQKALATEMARSIPAPGGRGRTTAAALPCETYVGANEEVCAQYWTAKSNVDQAVERQDAHAQMLNRARALGLFADGKATGITQAEVSLAQAEVERRATWWTDSFSWTMVIIHLVMIALVMWGDWTRAERRAARTDKAIALADEVEARVAGRVQMAEALAAAAEARVAGITRRAPGLGAKPPADGLGVPRPLDGGAVPSDESRG